MMYIRCLHVEQVMQLPDFVIEEMQSEISQRIKYFSSFWSMKVEQCMLFFFFVFSFRIQTANKYFIASNKEDLHRK